MSDTTIQTIQADAKNTANNTNCDAADAVITSDMANNGVPPQKLEDKNPVDAVCGTVGDRVDDAVGGVVDDPVDGAADDTKYNTLGDGVKQTLDEFLNSSEFTANWSAQVKEELKQYVARMANVTMEQMFDVDARRRFTLFPIDFPELFDMYKRLVSVRWIVDEIDFTGDDKAFEALPEAWQFFLKTVLAYFAASDGIVMENLAARFLGEVPIPEARQFYSEQCANEAVHSETYSRLIDMIIKDQKERDILLRGIDTSPAIKRKADFALLWLMSSLPFPIRVLGFLAVEGVQFAGSFCSIFWVKKQKIPFKGLFLSNEYISRDEGLHADFASALYMHIKPEYRVPECVVQQLFRDAVATEQYFCSQALPVALIGMNSDLMMQYIECVADRLLLSVEYEPIFEVENPFEWMMMLSLTEKEDFFGKRTTSYRKFVRTDDSAAALTNGDDIYEHTDEF